MVVQMTPLTSSTRQATKRWFEAKQVLSMSSEGPLKKSSVPLALSGDFDLLKG